MKTVQLALVLCLLFGQSCFSNKNIAPTNTDQKKEKESRNEPIIKQEKETSGNSRFIVSFISIGGGTDTKAHSLFLKHLSDYKEIKKDTLIVDIIPWGREGEVDYCFKLSELTASEQQKFIADVKNILKKSTLIRYKENAPCRRKLSINR